MAAVAAYHACLPIQLLQLENRDFNQFDVCYASFGCELVCMYSFSCRVMTSIYQAIVEEASKPFQLLKEAVLSTVASSRSGKVHVQQVLEVRRSEHFLCIAVWFHDEARLHADLPLTLVLKRLNDCRTSGCCGTLAALLRRAVSSAM